MKATVAVVGAGVIGLCTAILALEAGSSSVTIYSDTSPMETTSLKAAANFQPHEVTYDAVTHTMVATSWGYFERIVAQYPPDTSGVYKRIHWEASSSQQEQPPYLDVVEDFALFERPHVPGGYAFGWRYRTFFIDTPVFLPWLLHRFTAGGGSLVLLERFTGLEQLASLPSEIVFNCTGLGARELCHDETIIPIKGQIVIIDPQPHMDWSISADGFYVFPRTEDTVLGGTLEWGVHDETVGAAAVDLILRANKRILPHLNPALVRQAYAGLRPYRRGAIRLESQNVGGKRIIHNYGHGASGFSLCWGSAHLALELV